MFIKGLTDRPPIRRNGKIRAGYKDEKNRNRLVNTEHFLLHDAPQLTSVLGERPTEIYFTVHSDNIYEFFRSDLRWYNSSQLLCLSRHEAKDENNRPYSVPMAAYFGTHEVGGMSQMPFPGMAKARLRACRYKQCTDYVAGHCTEHMFLDVMIPQYSMGDIFTVDNTSINAIMNAADCFVNKAAPRYQGKLSGQIFKMYKKPGKISYQTADGKTGQRDAPIIHFEMVPFVEYEAKFKAHIRAEDWEALMYLRQRPVGMNFAAALEAPEEALALSVGTSEAPQLAAPGGHEVESQAAGEIEALRARANHEAVLPLFEQLAALVGRQNTETARIQTAEKFPSAEKLADYLKTKIAEAKKKQQATTPVSSDIPPKGAAQTGAAPSGATSENPLY